VGANASQTIDVSLGNLSINRLGGTSTQTGYVTHASAVPTLTQTTAPASSTTLNATGTWTQRGADIDGEALGDLSGYSVSLSEDGNTLAIGAPLNDNSNGTNTGHIRIYSWDGSAWSQLGSDIDGMGAAGHAVRMSSDGRALIFSGEVIGTTTDQIQMYAWDGSDWSQKGSTISSGSSSDFGWSVDMASDGNTVVAGALNSGSAGSTQVYDWNGSTWTRRGSVIYGEANGDFSGRSVSISDDGNIIAIGAANTESTGGQGQVRIFAWDGSAWIQRGNDIDGEASGDSSGFVVDISRNGNIVAIAAPNNDGNGAGSGQIRVFEWNGSAWVQLGSDIDGEASLDSLRAVSLNSEGTVFVGGTPLNDGNGANSGHARVFQWNGSTWVQLGSDIDGEATSDFSGEKVSMNEFGDSVAIGARYNDGNGNNSGHVRVYDWPTTTNYTIGFSKLDFNNLNLVTGDRITINAAGGTQVQGIIGADGLDALLASMASQIAAQTGLYGGASASSGVISITGLADGNSVSGLTVTLETDANNYSDSVSPTAITSVASATTSLSIIDRAMTQINSQRASYGAVMNRLEYAIDNLATMSTNVKASQSRIQDADYAKETTELARTQIIRRAATAILAQANQQAKIVMDILNWDK
jgi:flagellin-like hook-associated protein FlgL